jgi:1-phosphofructokinase family hexose kinase
MILSVCPNPAVDKISTADFSRPGKVKKLKDTIYCAGGKGINASRALKTLGAETLAIGLAGGHTGRFFEALLAEEGLKGVFARIKEPSRINMTLLGAKEGEEMHLVDRGPSVKTRELEELRGLFASCLAGGDVRCALFAGSLPPGAPEDFYFGLIEYAKRKGVKTALDSSGKALREAVKAKPDILKPNSRELNELAGAELKTIKEKINFAASLGIPETLVSMGAKGAFLAADGLVLRAMPLKAEAENSVGSGDALLAGYIFARSTGGGEEDALLTGSACALANLSNRVPGRILPEEADRFRKKIRISH